MKRITIFAGHYGSGKTTLAIKYAIGLTKQNLDVAIIDLDIVNPYFRTTDKREELEKSGIEVIASDYANSNVDFPAIPAQVYSAIDDRTKHIVIDLGGDDRGAYALGRYKDKILEENNYDMLMVINMYRPLTSTSEQVLAIKQEIESAAGLSFTGLVNNSNLGSQTTYSDIENSQRYTEQISLISKLPIYDNINFSRY